MIRTFQGNCFIELYMGVNTTFTARIRLWQEKMFHNYSISFFSVANNRTKLLRSNGCLFCSGLGQLAITGKHPAERRNVALSCFTRIPPSTAAQTTSVVLNGITTLFYTRQRRLWLIKAFLLCWDAKNAYRERNYAGANPSSGKVWGVW